MIRLFNSFIRPGYFFLIIFLLAAFFSFWKLGSNDLSEWDESRHGVNAYEMMHNGDYVNYYFAGKPDTYNAKPPFMVWLIILCYKIFGFNTFALRFTSALASVLFFMLSYKIINLYAGNRLAFIACLILLSCKAIIGPHVGRTGDTDALLICLLTASLYYFLLYHDFNRHYAVFLFAFFLGLAFYAKGTAAFILVPGLIVYSFITGKWKTMIADTWLWLALFMCIAIISSWLLLLFKFGNQFDASSFYKSKNAIETLFVHDTFNRLTSADFDTSSKPDRLFFFRVLDTRFNVWNYFFYLSILSGIVFIIRHRRTFWNSLIAIDQEKKLLVLSFCMVTPLSVFLSFAATKNNWYLAPVFLFITIIIAWGIISLSKKFSWFIFLFAGVLIFNLSRHFIYLNSPKQQASLFFERNKEVFKKMGSVKALHIPSQDFFLYLNWYTKKIEPDVSFENLEMSANDQLIFFDSRYLEKQYVDKLKIIDCFNNYCIATTK